jgi:hypothetical protein
MIRHGDLVGGVLVECRNHFFFRPAVMISHFVQNVRMKLLVNETLLFETNGFRKSLFHQVVFFEKTKTLQNTNQPHFPKVLPAVDPSLLSSLQAEKSKTATFATTAKEWSPEASPISANEFDQELQRECNQSPSHTFSNQHKMSTQTQSKSLLCVSHKTTPIAQMSTAGPLYFTAATNSGAA